MWPSAKQWFQSDKDRKISDLWESQGKQCECECERGRENEQEALKEGTEGKEWGVERGVGGAGVFSPH